MGNSNIVDFFTGQSYEKVVGKNSRSNDDIADKYGVYLGVLKQQDTKEIRELIDALNFKQEQVNQLTAERDWLYDEMQTFLEYCLDYLPEARTKNIDFDKDIVMVDMYGHTFLIYDYEETKWKHYRL